MKVSLFVSCLVDQLRPEVAESAVKVLRAVGCDVAFDPRQTCCGQPAFNSGYRDEACSVAEHFIDVYAGCDDPIVVPSGSCTAMIRHFGELFEGHSLEQRAREIVGRTYELADFLVNEVGVTDIGARFDGRVTWHDACHGLRELGLRDEPRFLLRSVRGLELVEVKHCDSCCGFGGTFSVKYPEISVAMLEQKLQAIEVEDLDVIASGDVSCLMQIAGRLEHRSSPLRTMHLAELLAHSLDN